jgi:hypothetical protein
VHSPPFAAAEQASKLSADHVLQHRIVERQIGHDLLDLAILLFELTQPLHLRRHQPGVLRAAIVECCVIDPCLATNLANRRALLRLPHNEGNLRFRGLRSLHAPSRSGGPNQTCRQTGIFQQ